MGWIGYDRAVGHKGTNSPRLYLVDWRRWIGLATIERAGHDGIERNCHDQVGWSRWGGLATIGWCDLATKGRFGYDVAGWPRLGRLVATGLRGLAKAGWVGHVGVGWHDEAISFNGVSLGISFVLDKIGCSMLVRLSGSTLSLDHSFDGISIGISLDHTLAISFWYVLLVEPSSCNLHEGTLVFLIQGGFSNPSPRL